MTAADVRAERDAYRVALERILVALHPGDVRSDLGQRAWDQANPARPIAREVLARFPSAAPLCVCSPRPGRSRHDVGCPSHVDVEPPARPDPLCLCPPRSPAVHDYGCPKYDDLPAG